MPGIFDLQKLYLCEAGLLNILDVDKKFPNLHVLDLRGNKIFSIDAIDILYKLKNLHTVNFSHNPIMVHAHLEEMIMESAP